MKNKIISPIAIDLGAKNTGVYFAHYAAGSSPEQIGKEGKVYQLEKDKYTLLMADRTAKRHQRRGYDRRQMAKRLFKLIWEKHFKLTWDKDVQQTISFLLNRRGFSFLTEEYDAKILSQFPQEAYELLPKELTGGVEKNEEGYDFASALTEWAQKGRKAVNGRFEAIQNIKDYKKFKEIDAKIKKDLYFHSCIEKISDCCGQRIDNQKSRQKKQGELSKTPKWVIEKLIKNGVNSLKEALSYDKYQIDLSCYLNEKINIKQVEQLKRELLNLDSIKEKEKLQNDKKENDKSIWNFNTSEFSLEKNLDILEDVNSKYYKKTHLHHLVFAVNKTLVELQSGGQHRSKYFEKVKEVFKETKEILETDKKDKLKELHSYLRRFYINLIRDEYTGLNPQKLHNLIGHISNLELKPLRKYFNDRNHRNDDYWCEKRIYNLFDRWILQEWRVGEKDKNKVKVNHPENYEQIKNDWKKYKQAKPDTLIGFWLNNSPESTIPPYQDNNNRRPPRCQSLILNTKFLDENYQSWKEWLAILKEKSPQHLGKYCEELQGLPSGKGKPYFSDEMTNHKKRDGSPKSRKDIKAGDQERRNLNMLDARVLQFIFDRIKNEDPLNLNEIYSHAKKIKQNTEKIKRDKRDGKCIEETEKSKKEAEDKLKNTLLDSKLPDNLKSKAVDGIYPENSFLHLICKYYKQRQRARDGRIFIHPKYEYIKGRGYENTGRFEDKDHLLTYCNHKPRQKRYQMLGDLAGLLQISPQRLQEFTQQKDGETIDEKLFNWLSGIPNLQTNCDRAAKEQKKRRGRLKLDIQSVFGLIYHRRQSESPPPKEIKQILKRSKVSDAQKLHSFCERATELCLTLTAPLYEDLKQQQWRKDLDKNPAAAVYLLAQINNIAFKERSGNANTCAVCSMDNAQRMQMILATGGKDTVAKAQCLPAIPTRLFDGAVMRMARIVGGAIAKDKWKRIKDALKEGNEVCVPIITESNRFEFEPSKEELVKGQRTRPRKGKAVERGEEEEIFNAKDDRIRIASAGICPYTGDSLSGGDKDHIIPRSSEWGTLNDEANFIWASDKGNKEVKKDKVFSLRNLKNKYKKEQFETTDDSEIENWIVEKIWDDSTEDFKFGPYRSFVNLGKEEQTAFRHALFLVDHPFLRKKVIAAIDNRTRTFVNGTQRYFTEVLANNLYKHAKTINKQHLLSFDYFGVEALDSSRGDGVHNLRKELVGDYRNDLATYNKEESQPQDSYSHLIDAQVAFCMMADAHRDEGGLRLNLMDTGLWSRVNKKTGEIYDAGLFNAIQVDPDDGFKPDILARRKPDDTFFAHRSFTRDKFYADRYMPVLLQCQVKSIIAKVGFDWQNSVELKIDTKKKNSDFLRNIVDLLPLCKGTRHLVGGQYTDLNDLFSALKRETHFDKQLRNNNYLYLVVDRLKLHEYWKQNFNTRTGREFESDSFVYKTLGYRTEKLKIDKPETLSKTLGDDKKFSIKVGGKSIEIPARKHWQDCLEKWKQWQEQEKGQFDQFLRDHFKSHTSGAHQKKRKVFSLPVLTKQGKIMLREKSWSGDYIYQIMNDSDSRSPDNKPNVPVRKEDGALGVKLATWAKSNNFVKLSNGKYDTGEPIDPSEWYMVDKNKFKLPDEIDQIWYRIDDTTAPSIAIKLAKDGDKIGDAEFMEKPICQHGFRKQKAKKGTENRPEESEKSPKDIRNKFFEEEIKSVKQGAIIIYKGASYKKEMRDAFKTAQVVGRLK